MRFPKAMLFVAVVVELMILTLASRTEILAHIGEPPVQVNRMSMTGSFQAPAVIINRSGQPNAAFKTPQAAGVEIRHFAKAPQNVI